MPMPKQNNKLVWRCCQVVYCVQLYAVNQCQCWNVFKCCNENLGDKKQYNLTSLSNTAKGMYFCGKHAESANKQYRISQPEIYVAASRRHIAMQGALRASPQIYIHTYKKCTFTVAASRRHRAVQGGASRQPSNLYKWMNQEYMGL